MLNRIGRSIRYLYQIERGVGRCQNVQSCESDSWRAESVQGQMCCFRMLNLKHVECCYRWPIKTGMSLLLGRRRVAPVSLQDIGLKWRAFTGDNHLVYCYHGPFSKKLYTRKSNQVNTVTESDARLHRHSYI